MATYKDIQAYIKVNKNIYVKTCWIADVKDKHGLSKRIAYNRISKTSKVSPCPEKYISVIEEAFMFFNMLNA
jgi:hypothetical protein